MPGTIWSPLTHLRAMPAGPPGRRTAPTPPPRPPRPPAAPRETSAGEGGTTPPPPQVGCPPAGRPVTVAPEAGGGRQAPPPACRPRPGRRSPPGGRGRLFRQGAERLGHPGGVHAAPGQPGGNVGGGEAYELHVLEG